MQCNRELELSQNYGYFIAIKIHSTENTCSLKQHIKWYLVVKIMSVGTQSICAAKTSIIGIQNKHRKMKSGFLKVGVRVCPMLGTGDIQDK